jgi:SAM-dependent methyltransferase
MRAPRAEEHAEFDAYFQRRASRFAALYRNRTVTRILGRSALFDRLEGAVEIVVALGASRVLDVGCGSGPLFGPLARRGVAVMGIDPADAMVALARGAAAEFPGMVTVEQRGWEDIDERDAYDAAVALGVFDYVDAPEQLLGRMGRAAPHVIASFPSPGLRLRLRQFRYGIHGVNVHGYEIHGLTALAVGCGLELRRSIALGRAGHLVLFSRGTEPRS